MPNLGMFGAVDRYAPGEMTYGYAGGNPIMFSDPRGEASTWLRSATIHLAVYVGVRLTMMSAAYLESAFTNLAKLFGTDEEQKHIAEMDSETWEHIRYVTSECDFGTALINKNSDIGFYWDEDGQQWLDEEALKEQIPGMEVLALISLTASAVKYAVADDAAAHLINEGAVSTVKDETIGNSIKNYWTDAKIKDVRKAFVDNGFTKKIKGNGSIEVYTKGNLKYSYREFAKSQGCKKTVEFFIDGVKQYKLRLEMPVK
jgi:hypothetical protein